MTVHRLPGHMQSAGPRSRRYDTRIVARVQELRAAGWSYDKVQDFVEREFGVRPARDTVMKWADPVYAERRRRNGARHERNRLNARLTGRMPGWSKLTPDFRLIRARALREGLGLEFDVVAAVMSFDFDPPVTGRQVRHALDTGKWPKTMTEAA